MIVVILAGGKGTRLWPLSNSETPKQFLKIKHQLSLIQQTYLRFANSKGVEKIAIVTSKKYKPLVEKHLKEINASCLLIEEPIGKNTLPAITLSLKFLKEKIQIKDDQKVLISPSDHFIEPEEHFAKILDELNKKDFQNKIVTFGVKPSYAETGYGYIHINKKDDVFYSVKKFVEKPNLKRARWFLKSQKYLWNAGFFLFTIETFWKELQEHLFSFYELSSKKYLDFLKDFEKLPSISFDYAILEKTKNIKIYPLDLTWSDVGSWDSVYAVLDKDDQKNATSGNVFSLETKNSLILADKKMITTIGLDNMIVVETSDGIFIGKKGESQKIKLFIEDLQNKKK